MIVAGETPHATASDAPEADGGAGNAMKMAALLCGIVAFQLNASMVAPAVPEIARRLGSSAAEVGLSQTLFFLAGGICGVVLARYSDHAGRRRVLVWSLIAMCAGTVVAMLAPNVPTLIAGRLMQGLCGGTFPIAYLILREILTPRQFGPALGLVSAISGGVAGADQFLGGLFSDRWGFRSIFLFILIVGVAAVALSIAYLPESKTRTQGRMDWPGAAALSAALICVSLGVNRADSLGWSNPGTLLLLMASAAGFAGFWLLEERSADPLIGTRHLRSLQVWPVVATTLAALTGTFAAINFTMVLFSQDRGVGYGLSATKSSLLFLSPAAFIGLLAAPASGWLAPRIGWRAVMRTGLALSAATLLAAALLLDHKWAVFAACGLLGVFNNGLMMTALNGLGVILSSRDSPGALPGLNGACFSVGAGLGIALVAPLAAVGTYRAYQAALGVSVAMALLALAISFWIRGAPDHAGEKI